jgi:pyroglutamyl-peptidase
MLPKVLLTSFQTWLPHHKSNSSDDLLALIQQQECFSASLLFLRQLPVEVKLASQQVIETIQNTQPHAVICCGMAESRKLLSIESCATYQHHCLQTSVNLFGLSQQLNQTIISYDAGKFVCEGLYYQVLNHLKQTDNLTSCIFVHVPILNQHNLQLIKEDFKLIIELICSLK